LNSSLKTPTSVAYFATLKATDLSLSFKVGKCAVFCFIS
jgi:hypothetical protein